MQEHYQRLIQMIEGASDSKSIKMETMLQEAVVFFNMIRTRYVQAEPEEKQELHQMMRHVSEQLQAAAQKLSHKTGMNEEAVKGYAENPSNFSKEEWRFLQASKEQLHNSVRQFSAAMQKNRVAGAPVAPPKSKVRTRKQRNWA